jgi:hypothetical protein
MWMESDQFKHYRSYTINCMIDQARSPNQELSVAQLIGQIHHDYGELTLDHTMPGKFKAVIAVFSNVNNEDTMLQEWTHAPIGPNLHNMCICSHAIQHNIYIKNTINNNILVVGNECINKLNPTKQLRLITKKQYNVVKTLDKTKQYKPCNNCKDYIILHPSNVDYCNKCLPNFQKKCYGCHTIITCLDHDQIYCEQCNIKPCIVCKNSFSHPTETMCNICLPKIQKKCHGCHTIITCLDHDQIYCEQCNIKLCIVCKNSFSHPTKTMCNYCTNHVKQCEVCNEYITDPTQTMCNICLCRNTTMIMKQIMDHIGSVHRDQVPKTCSYCNGILNDDMMTICDTCTHDRFSECYRCKKFRIPKVLNKIYCDLCIMYYKKITCSYCYRLGYILKGSKSNGLCDECNSKIKPCVICNKQSYIESDQTLCSNCLMNFKICFICAEYKYCFKDSLCDQCSQNYRKCPQCLNYIDTMTCKHCESRLEALNRTKEPFRLTDGSPLGDYVQQYLYRDSDKVNIYNIVSEYTAYLKSMNKYYRMGLVPELRALYPDILIEEVSQYEIYILNCGMRSALQ